MSNQNPNLNRSEENKNISSSTQHLLPSYLSSNNIDGQSRTIINNFTSKNIYIIYLNLDLRKPTLPIIGLSPNLTNPPMINLPREDNMIKSTIEINPTQFKNKNVFNTNPSSNILVDINKKDKIPIFNVVNLENTLKIPTKNELVEINAQNITINVGLENVNLTNNSDFKEQPYQKITTNEIEKTKEYIESKHIKDNPKDLDSKIMKNIDFPILEINSNCTLNQNKIFQKNNSTKLISKNKSNSFKNKDKDKDHDDDDDNDFDIEKLGVKGNFSVLDDMIDLNNDENLDNSFLEKNDNPFTNSINKIKNLIRKNIKSDTNKDSNSKQNIFKSSEILNNIQKKDLLIKQKLKDLNSENQDIYNLNRNKNEFILDDDLKLQNEIYQMQHNLTLIDEIKKGKFNFNLDFSNDIRKPSIEEIKYKTRKFMENLKDKIEDYKNEVLYLFFKYM